MAVLMARDNTPTRIDRLVEQYQRCNEEIEGTRRRAQELAAAKAAIVAQLRSMLPVIGVAEVLTISPPAVYKILAGGSTYAEEYMKANEVGGHDGE